MEVDQVLLESLPQDQRQKLARRVRQEQIRRYHEREKAQTVQPGGKQTSGSARKKVHFHPKDRLWEATARGEQEEGNYNNTVV